MPGSQHEGLDENVWGRLVEIVAAASRGDADGHALAVLTFSKRVPLAGHQQAGAYLTYLLYHQMRKALGRVPTGEDVPDLTLSTYPKFREVVVADEAMLEEAFRKALQLPPLRTALTAGEFMLLSSAALGAMLVDPIAGLDALRPGLALWIWRMRDAFPDAGIAG